LIFVSTAAGDLASAAVDVASSQVLAFRVAAQGLAERSGGADEVLRGWGVQDSPPGAAAAGALARAEAVAVDWPDAAVHEGRSAVAFYNARTATAIVPAGEAAMYAAALLPGDDAGFKAIVGPALPGRGERFAEPVALAVAAVADALDGVVLSRDELHAALRLRLPTELLPWCPGCKSHHARRGLLVMAALHGRLCLEGRAGRQPAFARTDQRIAWEPPPRAVAGAELVRRYLAGYGPSTPAHLAQWAGLGGAHARDLWARVRDELAEVRIDGSSERAWLLAGDLPRLQAPPAATGVRLLATGEPLLLGRDRERLVPAAAARKRVWTAINGAGLVLVDGAAAALWRARKHGTRLEVAVDAFAPVPRAAFELEAERLVPHRGCASATVEYA
jgi:hypothetical protein